MEVVASLENAKKTYTTGDTTITALDSTTLDINNRELILIMGPSGSGKTTPNRIPFQLRYNAVSTFLF